MIDILHTILTDASMRDAKAVEAQLSSNSAAGTPWVDAA
mgnify:CR=1 FL=1|jgi:hypothetical protein